MLENLWPRWLEAARMPIDPFRQAHAGQHLGSFICQLPPKRQTHMPHCFRAMAKGSSTFSLGASTSLAQRQGNDPPQAAPAALCTSTQGVGPTQATTPRIETVENSLVEGQTPLQR